MSIVKRYLLDIVIQLYTWTHIAWDFVHKIVQNTIKDREGAREVLTQCEELLGEQESILFRYVALRSYAYSVYDLIPIHTQASLMNSVGIKKIQSTWSWEEEEEDMGRNGEVRMGMNYLI